MIEQSTIKEMEDIMLSYLTKEMNPASVGFVHIEYEEDEEGIEEGTAYTTKLGQCAITQLKAFAISYDPQLKEDFKLFVTMLAHELTHVMQVLRGDVFDYSKPYREQPHEIEAYGREDEVATHYLNLIKERKTK